MFQKAWVTDFWVAGTRIVREGWVTSFALDKYRRCARERTSSCAYRQKQHEIWCLIMEPMSRPDCASLSTC